MEGSLQNHRIFIEKKPGFSSHSKQTLQTINELLRISSISSVRHLLVYDIIGISSQHLQQAAGAIFSEANRDNVLYTLPNHDELLAIEQLPGQFDQRSDSAIQCLQLLFPEIKNAQVFSGDVFLFEGNPTPQELTKIKSHFINPVECRQKDLSIPPSAPAHREPAAVSYHNGFLELNAADMAAFTKTHGFAMSLADMQHIQAYFKEENRNPTVTELKVLDTYWSDHCRHTTFLTEITDVQFPETEFGEHLASVYKNYQLQRHEVYGDRLSKKPVCLMDLATIAAKDLRKKGLLNDLEISDEINACSVRIQVNKEDGSTEPWLLMFKNETHNHPTEIEPFGGASTCLGGCIRDPLSGRAFVYQAMRVTGAANPLEKLEDTLEGKLPQKKITTEAAHGFSSYGNQIGLATTQVSEVFHPGYKAKRMEVGAVVAAAPEHWVKRLQPTAGDKIVLLGGKTGRDGVGGATGSSKEHTEESLATAGAEVQKGNAPEERKIQRFFRNEEVTTLIKKCNDFGAGGVSVAIGELADGLDINLDVLPTKYQGLDGTELALSESQERMAVVLDPKDVQHFQNLAEKENLETTVVAEVTDLNRLRMYWRGDAIVNLSRTFLDTNGARQQAAVQVAQPTEGSWQKNSSAESIKTQLLNHLSSLNIASQQGLAEMFDSSIGASTVHMPFGGKYQLTPAEGSLQKVATMHFNATTCSAMTWGFDPQLSSWSPFHGAAYAVVHSLAKLAAMGAHYSTTRFSFQEYFRKLGNEPKNWGLPFAALLGALDMQNQFQLPAIGGKDSMSGSFNDIHVPPTLISFAVNTLELNKATSNELKQAGNHLFLLKHSPTDKLPNTDQLKLHFDWLHSQIQADRIGSAASVSKGGLVSCLAKMAFGNKLGFNISCAPEDLFHINYGSIVIESEELLDGNDVNLIHLGEIIDDACFKINGEAIDLADALAAWQGTLEPVFPTNYREEPQERLPWQPFKAERFAKPSFRTAQPHVFIPAFPGTNCEYDSAMAFRKAGATTQVEVFRNLTPQAVEESIHAFAAAINNAQILMLPGGFSAGDEPDGCGKYITAILRNEHIKAAVERLLDRDGLILGICNGFQALVKSGLLPFGEIGNTQEDWPTLTNNKIGRHISQIVDTKVVSNNSPWLQTMTPGDMHKIAISHGEGRFMVSDKLAKQLFENGQVATQYVNAEGNPTLSRPFNPNGSQFAIEGITSPDGRIFGKMGHSERYQTGLFQNIPDVGMQEIFKNGVNYFL